MDRYYQISRLSKESEEFTLEKIEEILQEVREVQNLRDAEVLRDEKNVYLGVSTSQEKFPEVMAKIVNICSRVAKWELSFVGFEQQFHKRFYK